MGRVSMDLFSQNVGAPFIEIEGFATSVGGTPTNIAIGASRLGLNVAILTAVGDDLVGRFVRNYLENEGVDTRYIPEKEGTSTGLALLGIEPPDKFPLVFYRDNPADIYVDIDDVRAIPLKESRALLLSGTGLSRGPRREATLFALEQARQGGVTIFLDLDMRPDQWRHPRAFGLNLRPVLPLADVVIGTEEEFYAVLMPDPENVMNGDQLTAGQYQQLETLILSTLERSSGEKVMILKRGAKGARFFTRQGEITDVPGFPVKILNTVGAGDAFASGLIYGRLQGWDWYRSVRMSNACGAIVVTRHGCAVAMPYNDEVLAFIETNGGF
jgi:5-dehydro-2-deoxygluconokinase